MKNEQILGLLNPLIALVFAITFFVFWWKYKDKSYIIGISFAYLMMGTGFLISHLAADVNGIAHVFGTNFLFSMGVISIIWAACYRSNLNVPLGLLGLLPILGISVLAYVHFNPIEFNARLFVMNTAFGIMFAIGAVSLFKNISAGPVEKLLFAMFVLMALQFWIRPISTVSPEGSFDHQGYRDSFYYSVLNATIALLALMLALSLMAACVVDIMAEIRTKTENDLLTGLKIRRVFEDQAKAIFEDNSRVDLPMAMILADIDHFKNVNDNFGHQVGDRAIAAFGKLLREQVRDSDFAGRVGGEEFCIILWNANAQTARLVAENIRYRFSQIQIAGLPKNDFLTASFGVAESRDGDDYDTLFKRADEALYASKKNGRDRVTCPLTRDESSLGLEPAT
ncbi:MAG: GGDEF domain-containing protein [Rhizobiaceae bacterium]|nr:GGDEF domain-containing protein [Rhizobiaceae bacterium]